MKNQSTDVCLHTMAELRLSLAACQADYATLWLEVYTANQLDTFMKLYRKLRTRIRLLSIHHTDTCKELAIKYEQLKLYCQMRIDIIASGIF